MSNWIDGPNGTKLQRTGPTSDDVMMQCPNGHRAFLDADQLHGRVSVICPGYDTATGKELGCNYHETHDFGAFLPA